MFDTKAARQIEDKIEKVCQRLKKDPKIIRVCVVSKTRTMQEMEQAYDYGFREFAENRILEAEQKIVGWKKQDVIWHMIGHLQSNKSRKAAALFQSIQSVDSLRLLEHLHSHANSQCKSLRVLLEVNISNEPQKYGFDFDSVAEAVAACQAMPCLELEGLMGMGALEASAEQKQQAFLRLAALYDKLRNSHDGRHLKVLSMGMSQDYELALECGSTMLRIGRAFFK